MSFLPRPKVSRVVRKSLALKVCSEFLGGRLARVIVRIVIGDFGEQGSTYCVPIYPIYPFTL